MTVKDIEKLHHEEFIIVIKLYILEDPICKLMEFLDGIVWDWQALLEMI